MDLDPKSVTDALPAVLKPIMGFLEKIGGPALQELGLLFGDKVRLYRFQNSVRMFEKAKAICEKHAIEPASIPLRTLLPLLDGASIEDNDSLADMWAGLLASAADPRRSPVSPAFARILSNLRPIDATLLDLLYEHESRGGTVVSGDGQEIDRAWTLKSEALRHLSLTEREFSLASSILAAEGLVEAGGRLLGGMKMPFANMDEFGLTDLGSAFVRACKGLSHHTTDKKIPQVPEALLDQDQSLGKKFLVRE